MRCQLALKFYFKILLVKKKLIVQMQEILLQTSKSFEHMENHVNRASNFV